MPKIEPKITLLFVINFILSAASGFLLKDLTAVGLSLDTLLRLVFLTLSLLLASSFLVVFSLAARGVFSRMWRFGGYIFFALSFSIPFFLPPPILPFSNLSQFYLLFLIPVVYLVGLLFLDQAVGRATSTFSIFAARIFSKAYSTFFLSLVLLSGLLAYFLSVPEGKVEIKNLLEPVVRPISTQIVDIFVVGPIREQIGRDLTEEEFVTVVVASGILDQFAQLGFAIKEEETRSPEGLSAGLTRAVLENLDQELAKVLGPYIVFIPIIIAIGTVLTFLFFTPIFVLLATLSFAAVYRALVFLRFAKFEDEQRIVKVFKLA